MNEIINTISDLRRHVSARLTHVELDQYGYDKDEISYDDIVEDVAWSLLFILETEYGFKYGHEIPSYQQDLFELVPCKEV